VAESYLRQSPLAHRALETRASDEAGAAALAMTERRFSAKIGLRGEPDPDAVKRATGVALPGEPNTVAEGNNLVALWLGPQEWLVVGPPEAETGLAAALGEAVEGSGAAVVDVTEGRTVIRIAGPMARDVLSMGCPLDLHPRVFGPGRCAQSFLGRSSVILHQVDDGPTFDIYVERSQADYLWLWLETAARPYGVAVTTEPPAGAWRRPAKRRAKASGDEDGEA